jgi:hypothetical protein
MHSHDLALRLIERFGKTLGLEGLTLEGGTHSCALEFDGSLIVNFEFHEPSEQMVITSLLAPLPEDDAEPLLRLLMQANATDYLQANGLFSLEPQSQGVMLMHAKPVAELDDATFERQVEAFVNKLEVWKQRIAQLLEDPSATVAAMDAAASNDITTAPPRGPERPYDGAHIFG